MANSSLGSAVLQLLVNDKQFSQGMKTAKDKAVALQQTFLKVGGALTAVGAGFVVAAKKTIDLADETAKMSRMVGISVESLSAYRHATELSGTSVQTLFKGLQRLSRGVNDAAHGTGQATRAYKELQIEVLNVDGSMKSTEEVLLQVADRFSQMEDGTQKTALAMEIFGRSGAEMIPMLNEGSAGIERMKQEASDLGLVMSTEAANSAEGFNDALTRLQNAFKGLANVFIESGLLDKLTELVNWIAQSVAEFGKAHPVVTQVIAVMGLLAAAIGPVLIALGLMLPAITGIVAVISGPVGIVIAIGALVTALGVWMSNTESGGQVWAAFKELLVATWDVISGLVKVIANALIPIFKKVVDALQRGLGPVLDAVTKGLGKMTDGVKAAGEWFGVMEGDADSGADALDGVEGKASDAEDALWDTADALEGASGELGVFERATRDSGKELGGFNVVLETTEKKTKKAAFTLEKFRAQTLGDLNLTFKQSVTRVSALQEAFDEIDPPIDPITKFKQIVEAGNEAMKSATETMKLQLPVSDAFNKKWGETEEGLRKAKAEAIVTTNSMKKGFSELGTVLDKDLIPSFDDLLSKDGVMGGLGKLKDKVIGIFTGENGILGSFKKLGGLFGDLFGSIKGFVGNVGNLVGDVLGGIKDTVMGP